MASSSSLSSPQSQPFGDGTGFCTERFLQEVPNRLLCQICLGVLNHPSKTPCEHVFCGTCLLQWLSQSRHPTCPTCRQDVELEDIRPVDRILEQIIGDLSVHCKHWMDTSKTSSSCHDEEQECCQVTLFVDTSLEHTRCLQRWQCCE